MVDVRRLPVGEDNEIAVTLDELAREGARRMIATALEAEVADYVERFAEERDEDGKRLVVRNGRARERRVTIGFFVGGGGFAVLDSEDAAELQRMTAENPFTPFADVEVHPVVDPETALRTFQELFQASTQQ